MRYIVYMLISSVFKGTTSPAERCDLGGVKLEKVHDLKKFTI